VRRDALRQFFEKKWIAQGLQPCAMATRCQQSSDAAAMMFRSVTVAPGCLLQWEGAATAGNRMMI
jgi:hypothetical protein